MKWLLVVVGLCAGVALAESVIVAPVGTKSTLITGLCEETYWRAYKTRDGNLWVGCGAAQPPAGSREMRSR
jgi:hypothetical protein